MKKQLLPALVLIATALNACALQQNEKQASEKSLADTSISPRLYPVSQQERWGYIDRTGRLALPTIYEDASEFHEGLARVKTDGKWGFIDETGHFVIEPRFGDVGHFSEGLAPARTSSSGTIFMIMGYSSWIRERGGCYGFIDRKGEFVISEKYDGISYESFHDGLALVYTYKQKGCRWAVKVYHSWAVLSVPP